MLTKSILQEAAATRRLQQVCTSSSLYSDELGAKPAPLFINIGRGDVITTEELLGALDDREEAGLSYAVLDVVEEEPLPQSNPLWTHPRVTVTPHISAISTPELVMGVFIENLEIFLQLHDHITHDELTFELIRKLNYVVDRSKGY